MVPKNEMVTLTRVPGKQLSWIDRMYMKLENICLEVDNKPSLLLQETSKYMESQMNVVGANVRKLCAELIQDLLPSPISSSEMAAKKPESALLCTYDCVAEKPKHKEANQIWEEVLDDVQAKGLNTDTSAPEDHSSSSATCMENVKKDGSEIKCLNTDTSALEDHSSSSATLEENSKEGGGSEVDCNGLGEAMTQWEGMGKVPEFDGRSSSLEESSIQSEVEKETGMLTESEGRSEVESNSLGEATSQCEGVGKGSDLYGNTSRLGYCATQSEVMGEADNIMEQGTERHCNAQPLVKGVEPQSEGEMHGISPYGFNVVSVARCFKERDHLVRNPAEQLDEEQDQSAQWFVSEDQRKIYRLGNSTYASSFYPFGETQTQGSLEDFESDWELV